MGTKQQLMEQLEQLEQLQHTQPTLVARERALVHRGAQVGGMGRFVLALAIKLADAIQQQEQEHQQAERGRRQAEERARYNRD